MKKIFIVALCVAGMMSSCSDIDDNIANDAKSSILLTQQEYASMVDRNTTNLDFETSFNGHYNQDLKLYPNVRKK